MISSQKLEGPRRGRPQEEMERSGRKGPSCARSEEMETAGDR
jgi:hypothetical protein